MIYPSSHITAALSVYAYTPMVGLRSPDRTSHIFGLSFSPCDFESRVLEFSILHMYCYLTLGYVDICYLPRSGSLDSNQNHKLGDKPLILRVKALPLSYFRKYFRWDLNPQSNWPRILSPVRMPIPPRKRTQGGTRTHNFSDLESDVSANSTTRAKLPRSDLNQRHHG